MDPLFFPSSPPMCWYESSVPSAGNRAAATRAAPGVGYRHVLRGYFAKLSDSMVLVNRNIIVNSGASGVYSNIIFAHGLSTESLNKYALGYMNSLELMTLENTALSCQFSAVGANEVQACTVWGYTIRV